MDIDYEQRLAELRTRFVARAGDDRRSIAEAIQAQRWDDARRLCHGLAGIAGTFGFQHVGDAAYALEETIDTDASAAQREKAWLVLDELLGRAAFDGQAQP